MTFDPFEIEILITFNMNSKIALNNSEITKPFIEMGTLCQVKGYRP